MNPMSRVAKALLFVVACVGLGAASGCGSDQEANEARSVGTLSIPLTTEAGGSTYRLEALIVIRGQQGDVALSTHGDEAVLSSALPAGSYHALLRSFTLFKDDGTGTFHAVQATVQADDLAFSILANSTTAISFRFETDGEAFPLGSGDLSIGFEVDDTSQQCASITVDPAARTVRTGRFFLDFSNGFANNPDALEVLRWAGGPDLTAIFSIEDCSSGLAGHFGNSWAPPDPQGGGQVLVGAGSVGSWEQDGRSILIHSTSSECVPSASVPVETRYSFPSDPGADTFDVERRFDFTSTALDQPFRPFVPRLRLDFDRVLHPNAGGTTLLAESVFTCPVGCELTNWDGSWFAYYASTGPFAGQGMIVLREERGLPAHLWLDFDGGPTATNASSALLLPPAGGFPDQVEEKERFCFFDAASWNTADQLALDLPPGCTFDLECDGGESGQPAFTELSAGEVHTCGLRSDGSVACSGEFALDPPPISFEQIAVGLYHGCGIRSDDRTIVCWGGNGAGQTTPPAGSFDSIAAGRMYNCVVSTAGTLSCWGLDGFGHALVPPSGTYRSVGPGSAAGRLCAIRSDDTVACFGPSSGDGSAPPPGSFKAVASGLFESCGITLDGHLTCWDMDFRQAVPPAGEFSSLALGSISGCAIRTNGTLACWGEDTAGNTYPPSGSFKSVAVGQDYGCAIRSDGEISCWGSQYAQFP